MYDLAPKLIKHKISIAQKLKYWKIKMFHVLKLSFVVFFLQINVKMPTIELTMKKVL